MPPRNTIILPCRVMVMDKGLIAELDKPETLLNDENSVFHSMAKSAGLVHNYEQDKQQEYATILDSDVNEYLNLTDVVETTDL